jgi:hypothetical protein
MEPINVNCNEEIRVLSDKDMVIGIGRKASNKELMGYLLKEINVTPINIELAFKKYSDQK